MKITSIKQQAKRKDRYSIFIDGEYSFSLSEADFATSGLRTGDDLSQEQIQKFKNQSEQGKAYERVVRYISIRPRSRWEIEQYLKRKGYDEALTRSLLVKTEKLGLVNDEDFAKQWVQWRINSGGRSKQRLRAELRQKKIDAAIIDEALSEIDESAETEQIKTLIERKTKQSRYRDRQKLMAYLARQGYSYNLIKQAMEESE